MNGYVLDLNALFGPILLVHLDLFHVVQYLEPLDHFAEDGVLPVEVRRRGKRDEELAPIGVRALVGHADYASSMMPQGRTNLVFKKAVGGVVDGWGGLGLGVRCRATRLDHEVGNEAVEGAAIEKVGGAQSQEVLGRLGHRLAEDLDFEVAERSVKLQWSQWVPLARSVHVNGPMR
jgi:hypothetical protein